MSFKYNPDAADFVPSDGLSAASLSKEQLSKAQPVSELFLKLHSFFTRQSDDKTLRCTLDTGKRTFDPDTGVTCFPTHPEFISMLFEDDAHDNRLHTTRSGLLDTLIAVHKACKGKTQPDAFPRLYYPDDDSMPSNRTVNQTILHKATFIYDCLAAALEPHLRGSDVPTLDEGLNDDCLTALYDCVSKNPGKSTLPKAWQELMQYLDLLQDHKDTLRSL